MKRLDRDGDGKLSVEERKQPAGRGPRRRGGLDLDAVVSRLLADLRRRDPDVKPPSDPLHDEAFVDLLREAYVREPVVFDS